MIEALCKKIADVISVPFALVVCIVIQIVWMLIGTLTHFDPYPFVFMLTISNVIQLIMMFVIAVSQRDLHDKHDALHEKIDAKIQ